MDDDVLSNLSPDQLSSLQEFRDIAQTDDIGRAVLVLGRNSWDMQAAIDDFFRNSDIGGNAPPATSPLRPQVQGSSRTSDGRRPQSQNGGISTYFQWLFQSIPTALDPDEDSARFESDFERDYGTDRPDFFRGSYTKAVANAFQNSKFLLVYLHSPLHGDSPEFCRCAVFLILLNY